MTARVRRLETPRGAGIGSIILDASRTISRHAARDRNRPNVGQAAVRFGQWFGRARGACDFCRIRLGDDALFPNDHTLPTTPGPAGKRAWGALRLWSFTLRALKGVPNVGVSGDVDGPVTLHVVRNDIPQ